MANMESTVFQPVRVGSKLGTNVCFDTQRICLEAARYCMERGGVYVADERIRLLLDTAALCHTVMDTVCRDSFLHTHAAETCAALCEKTAASCERFPEDKVLMRCARLCRQCQEYCNETSPVAVA